MKIPKARRVTRVLTVHQQAALRQHRGKIARELPDMVKRDQMRKEASDEPTLSGELRRAIHSNPLSLSAIAGKAGIPPLVLDEFLTGERTLRSDVLDRLAASLGLAVSPRG
jgi:hypothetical protein